MSETTVTFLDYDPTSAVYTQSVRVFELEISQNAANYYAAAMEQVRDAFTAIEANPNDTASIDTALSILGNLDAWSKYLYVEGGVEQSNTSLGLPDYNNSNNGNPILASDLGTMDRYMAEDVDRLIRTLRAAGCDPISKTSLNSAYDLSGVFQKLLITDKNTYGVDEIVTSALSAAEQARISTDVWTQSDSIQQLLMVDYITRGNTLLYDQMSGLKTAIDINQSALTYLNSLQDLMNQKDPEHFVLALQNLSGDISIDASSAYSTFEKDTFNQELSNVPKFTSDNIKQFLATSASVSTTTDPTIAETAGVALGSFQLLSGEPISSSEIEAILQTYLTSKSVTTTVSSISDPSVLPTSGLHGQLDYGAAVTAIKPDATDDDKEIWWTAFAQVNGLDPSASTYASSINDPTLLASFTSYVADMSSNIGWGPGYTGFLSWDISLYYTTNPLTPPIPISFSTRISFPGLVGGTDYLTLLTDAMPADKFTDAERLKVWQVFMAGEGYTAGGTDPTEAFSSQADFKAYLTQIADILFSRTLDTRVTRIMDNLQYLMNQIQLQAGDSGKSLKDQLQVVYNDFETISKNSGSVSDWVKDYSSGNVGGYQTNLNNTIVASQSLNDTKSEELKNVMFIYEEFYKSATAMLSSLQQLLVKLAGAISR